MPLDPVAQKWLDGIAASGIPPWHTMSAEEARAKRTIPPPGPDVHRVQDMQAAGPEGPIPLRIYWPSDETPLPVLVWYHGGGWVLGDLESADATCRRLANLAQCIVISVDYRRAPEAAHPAAVDDAYAVVVWAAQNGRRFGGDPERIAVGGDSAGGTLAAVVAQLVRDRGGPTLRQQLLVYPVTDCTGAERPSYRENDGYILSAPLMDWFLAQYCPEGVDRTHPTVSPLHASSLERLAPAHVLIAEYDPLRDEGRAYADALREAGVAVEFESYDGQIHGFFNNAHVFPEGMRAVEAAAASLKRAFAQ